MTVRGNLIIVSGPSGAGKSAISAGVLEQLPGMRFSISYTTRPPRGGEESGVHYSFVSRDEFDRLIRAGELLEWAEVYGNLYGTSRKLIDEGLAGGQDVLLDVDVQGAKTICQKRPGATSVFIMPPSYGVLRERLEQRKLDKAYVIEQRLRVACEEIRQYADYDYLIINSDLGKAIEELKAIVTGSRCRMRRRAEDAQAIVATFGGGECLRSLKISDPSTGSSSLQPNAPSSCRITPNPK
jgi:guanylate kinase